jgi:ubiquitin-protein ligase
MIETQHQYIDVYVSDSNMGFWKVVMQGPPASPYEDGTFLLYIELGDQFPRKAPTARFITPILHPNVTKHGRICHPIFDREWTPATRIYQVIQQLWGILMSLEARDAIDPLFTLKFWTDPESGRREVKQYVQRFALPSRAAHRANILNGTSLSSLTPSAASSSPPPSYRTNPPTHSPTVLSSHLLSLRRSGRNSSSGSGSPVL